MILVVSWNLQGSIFLKSDFAERKYTFDCLSHELFGVRSIREGNCYSRLKVDEEGASPCVYKIRIRLFIRLVHVNWSLWSLWWNRVWLYLRIVHVNWSLSRCHENRVWLYIKKVYVNLSLWWCYRRYWGQHWLCVHFYLLPPHLDGEPIRDDILIYCRGHRGVVDAWSLEWPYLLNSCIVILCTIPLRWLFRQQREFRRWFRI